MPKDKKKRMVFETNPSLELKARRIATNLGYPYKADAIRFSIEFTDAFLLGQNGKKHKYVYK